MLPSHIMRANGSAPTRAGPACSCSLPAHGPTAAPCIRAVLLRVARTRDAIGSLRTAILLPATGVLPAVSHDASYVHVLALTNDATQALLRRKFSEIRIL
jgi:hypothetical protein